MALTRILWAFQIRQRVVDEIRHQLGDELYHLDYKIHTIVLRI